MWKPRTPASTPMRGMTTRALALALLLGAGAAGAADIPEDARAAWDLLRTAEVREEGDGADWRAVKIIPDSLRAASEGFTVTGFLVPILAEAELTTFLLVEQPENCPFCGNGGYGPVLEVMMAEPLPDMPEFTELTLQGRLDFNEDPYTFQLYRLQDARHVAGGP